MNLTDTKQWQATFNDAGFTHVSILKGGVRAWKDVGLPTNSPSQA